MELSEEELTAGVAQADQNLGNSKNVRLRLDLKARLKKMASALGED